MEVNIVEFLNKTACEALVCVDELGSGCQDILVLKCPVITSRYTCMAITGAYCSLTLCINALVCWQRSIFHFKLTLDKELSGQKTIFTDQSFHNYALNGGVPVFLVLKVMEELKSSCQVTLMKVVKKS